MRDNSEASAGGIVTFIAVILIGGMMFITNGFAIDRITAIMGTLPHTVAAQFRFDIVNYQIMVFRVEPIILLLGAGLNYLVNNLREYSGTIALSTIVIGAVEMIFLTLAAIALTLFGGQGIDMVVDVVDSWAIGGEVSDLFFATQFIGPVFYGLMLLVTIGLVIQFLILCVQTVDYSTSRYAY